jgi:hypothetical protein
LNWPYIFIRLYLGHYCTSRPTGAEWQFESMPKSHLCQSWSGETNAPGRDGRNPLYSSLVGDTAKPDAGRLDKPAMGAGSVRNLKPQLAFDPDRAN